MKTLPYSQPTFRPTRKVGAVGIAGIASTAVVSLIDQFGADLGISTNMTLGAFVAAVVGFAAGWLRRERA